MNNFELNIPVSIFIVGAILFLLAPLMSISSFSANEMHKLALVLESIGVSATAIVFFREKQLAE